MKPVDAVGIWTNDRVTYRLQIRPIQFNLGDDRTWSIHTFVNII